MRIILLFLTMFILFTSCKKSCKKYDCPINKVYSFSGRILDYNTLENIFYSNNPLYLKDNLKVFSIMNGDTNFHFVEHFEVDSSFRVTFEGEKNSLFVSLNESDIDTFKLNIYYLQNSYNQNEPICCPNNKTITGIYYNGLTFNPTANGTIFYKK